jgi:hypothetical protein
MEKCNLPPSNGSRRLIGETAGAYNCYCKRVAKHRIKLKHLLGRQTKK